MANEHQEAINNLARNLARAATTPATAEIIYNAVENGLAIDPVPTPTVVEFANATGLKNSETRAIIHDIAGPLVGFAPQNISDASCGKLHPPLAADPDYVAKRDEELECLSKNSLDQLLKSRQS